MVDVNQRWRDPLQGFPSVTAQWVNSLELIRVLSAISSMTLSSFDLRAVCGSELILGCAVSKSVLLYKLNKMYF